MKQRLQSRSGQTAVEYILLIAVVVGLTFALKGPTNRFLVNYFTSYTERAKTAAAKPTDRNYVSSTKKGCSTATGGNVGGQSCE